MVAIALVVADVRRHIVHRIERGVEWIDLLERQHGAVGQFTRLVHLAAFQQVEKNVERGWPGANAHAGAGFCKRFGYGKSKSAVIGHASHKGALAGEINREHGHNLMSECNWRYSMPQTVTGRSVNARRARDDRVRLPRHRCAAV